MGKNNITVYVKDENQLQALREKYSDVDADYVNMEGQKDVAGLLPMVCFTEKGEETCDTGEAYLKKFSKRL
jgi:hypothetical protein